MSYFKPRGDNIVIDVDNLDVQLISVEKAVKVAKYVNQAQKLAESSANDDKSYVITSRKDQIPIIQWMIKNRRSAEIAVNHFKLKNGVSTVRNWRKIFQGILDKVVKENSVMQHNQQWDLAVEKFLNEEKKKGRPTLLTDADQNALIGMIKYTRKSDGKVTPLIIITIARGIMEFSSADYKGIELTVHWARALLKKMKWTKRKVTTDRKLTLEELSAAANEAKILVEEMDGYHPDLVLEMDETLAPWAPMDDSTYAPKGESKVSIQGHNDKRGNTATITITRSGKLLPLQLIWSGKTKRSIPKCTWPEGFLNCFSGPSSKGNKKGTKWQNAKTIVEYLKHIVISYIENIRKDKDIIAESEFYEHKLGALLVMDHHWSHLCPEVEAALHNKNIDIRMIPKKATDLFSVLDVSINRPFKSYLKNEFTDLITRDITAQLKDGIHPENIKLDLRASRIKPNCGEMIVSAYHKLQKKAESMILNGFKKVEKNIEISLDKVMQSFASPPALTREELKAEFSKNPDRVWFVRDIGTCIIAKFEGEVHGDDLLQDQISIVMKEVFKNVELPFPNQFMSTFGEAKGSFARIQDSWISLEDPQAKNVLEDIEAEAEECDDDNDDYEEDDPDNGDSSSAEKLYCICQIPEPDESNLSSPMVECDYCGEWFHWKCVRSSARVRIPDENTEWFCSICVTKC